MVYLNLFSNIIDIGIGSSWSVFLSDLTFCSFYLILGISYFSGCGKYVGNPKTQASTVDLPGELWKPRAQATSQTTEIWCSRGGNQGLDAGSSASLNSSRSKGWGLGCISINKVLLEHSYAHSFTDFLETPMICKAWRYLLFGHLPENTCWFLL